MNKISTIILVLVVLVLVAGAEFMFSGRLYMGADIAPGSLESSLAMKVVDAWLDHVKPDTQNPVAPTPDNLIAGMKIYRSHCAGCHGDKEKPHRKFGLSLSPPAPQFMEDAPDMADNLNFAVIKHGTRWTGMPAWKDALTDQEIWTLATFLGHMKQLPPEVQDGWSQKTD